MVYLTASCIHYGKDYIQCQAESKAKKIKMRHYRTSCLPPVFRAAALPKKFKLLIAMTLDASHGAVEGVRSLVEQAMKAGAAKEETTETIRSAQYIRGVGCVYAAARTFKDLFVPGTFDLTDTVKVSRIITTPTNLRGRPSSDK